MDTVCDTQTLNFQLGRLILADSLEAKCALLKRSPALRTAAMCATLAELIKTELTLNNTNDALIYVVNLLLILRYSES